VREEAITVEGELAEAVVEVPNGVSTHRFCARCMCRIYGVHTARPGLAIVRAGTIDGGETLTPVMHIFTSTKASWIALPEDVPAWAENAPVEEWKRLFA